jgi:hypothetical protein
MNIVPVLITGYIGKKTDLGGCCIPFGNINRAGRFCKTLYKCTGAMMEEM